MATYDAILPAGGEIDAAFAAEVGTRNKALIGFGQETILERTIGALRGTGVVGRIVVIGPDEVQELARDKADMVLPVGATGPDNIMRGLEALSALPDAQSKVIVCTTDLPFLDAALINAFLAKCPIDADICLPLVTKAQYQTRFPNSHATFIPLQDDTWTAGNIYLLDADALGRAKPYIDRIFKVRKSKLGMARLLGPGFLIRFLRKQLTIPEVEAKILNLLQCSGKAILECPAELAYDIDDLDDYLFAKDCVRP